MKKISFYRADIDLRWIRDDPRLKLFRTCVIFGIFFPSRRGTAETINELLRGYGNRSLFKIVQIRRTIASSNVAVIVDTVTTAIVNVLERRRRERKLVITNYRFLRTPSLFSSAVITLKINGGDV